MLICNAKYIDIHTGAVIGYRVTEDGMYNAVVSAKKAVELNVQDASCLEFMDFDVMECVTDPRGRYAVVDKEIDFDEEFAEIPYRFDGVRITVFGHIFRDTQFCEIDNEYAIQRALGLR